MKRIKAACLCQTIQFMLKEDVEQSYAASLVQQDVENYKTSMSKRGIKYKILSEETQPDGTVILQVIKQYMSYPVGSYLD